jgi:hypothetical protein
LRRVFLNNFHTDAFGGFLEMYDELNDSFGRNCEIKFSLTLKNSDAKKSKTHETAYRFNSYANNYVWLNFIQRTDFSKNFSGFVVKGYVEIVLTMIWVNVFHFPFSIFRFSFFVRLQRRKRISL